MKKINFKQGLSLVEMMVVISIIAILSGIIYASFEDARKQSRDKSRMAALKELQLAVELYKAQNGTYPPDCSGGYDNAFLGSGPASHPYTSCEEDYGTSEYIMGLSPDFIDSLPQDPNEDDSNKGFFYRVNSGGVAYKILVRESVESITVTSSGDEFARCPTGTTICNGGENDYAVYSVGAEDW